MSKVKVNKISGIYMLTSPNGKIYIGQSNNIYDRMRRYSYLHCKGQKHLYNSLKLYGFKNHKFEILQQVPEDQLDIVEQNYIWRYNSANREIGYNLSFGGKRCKHSEESKLLIRANHPKCKKVFTIIEDKQLVFQSVGDAARQMNTTRRSIKQSIKGNCKISNLQWYFK